MKKIIPLLLLSLILPCGYAQDQLSSTQLTFAYYGNVAFEQGARIGAQFHLQQWDIAEENKKPKTYSLYLQPNLGFISRPLFYSNFQAAVDCGIRRWGKQSKYYHALNAGLGYLARMEIVSFTVDFKGEVIAREREVWDYLMPMLSYEVGKNIAHDIGWFVKLNYGLRLPLQESQEQSGMPLLEVGIKLPLKAKRN